MPAPGVDIRQFIERAADQERFYWHDANSKLRLAGFGTAAELIAWGKTRFRVIERQAQCLFRHAVITSPSPLAIPRLFGGFAFRDDFVPDHTWAVFHPAHFILPHFQLTDVGSQTWLTINTLMPEDEVRADELDELWQALRARLRWLFEENSKLVPPDQVSPPPVKLHYPLTPDAWDVMVNEAVRQIRLGRFRKVVLARASEIACGDTIHVGQALQFLDQQYRGCYRFLFEPQSGHAFLGASPELLVQVSGSELATMALAGSIRRGATLDEDARLSAEMLGSPKERYEHHLVVEELRRRLRPRSSHLDIPSIPGVLQFQNIQHLHTPVRASLRRPVGVLRVLASLHPTPALGGSPRQLAMEYIRQAEPVPRGWYAAPVGWLGPDLDGEFAVAIRSAVIQDQRAWLYAGAGIVAASQAEQEWKETALKLRPIMQALGVEGISTE